MHTIKPILSRIEALRSYMRTKGWDAVIISGTDPHSSEYLPARWQQRKWISGFTGSYGTVVITRSHAGLWTDTRYFIQARLELEGTGIALHPLRVPDAVDYPQWLAAHLPRHAVVGIDGGCMSFRDVEALKKVLASLQGRIDASEDFLQALWSDRPGFPMNPVYILEEKYSGRSAKDKIAWLRESIRTVNCSHILLNELDQIAWLFNIRSQDVPFNTVAISYALVGMEKAELFITPGKTADHVARELQNHGITLAPYDSLTDALQKLRPGSTVMADGSTLNYTVFTELAQQQETVHVKDHPSPVILEKAIKNDVEIDGFRKAFLQDGIAMVRFLYWLEKEMTTGSTLTEQTVSKKLSTIRALAEEAMGDSFPYISAYGPHAALPHYSHGKETGSRLEQKGLYLIDSGGQYLTGTTDITRTIPLGPLTHQEREDYTVALKGMIALSAAVFLAGTKGTHLDILAREPLWKYFRNYGHGTGHGIGHFLCVHEGPQEVRMTWKDQDMLPGMVTSNEPGIYREGSHGVRHENILFCKVLKENEFGEWLGFETLTLCHIDTSALLTELMERWEINWLNTYNNHVFNTLSPHLTYDESVWLKEKTTPVSAP